MGLNTREWMKSVGFKDETIEKLLPEFTDAVSSEIEKGYLRQSDYSKSMNDLKKTQDQLAAANDKLTADMAEWADMTAAEKATATKLKDDLDKSQETIFKLETKIKRLAEDSGLDPKTVLDHEPTEPVKPKAPDFDANAFRTELGNQVGGAFDYLLDLNAQLPAIAEEHFALTGEKLDTRAFVKGIRDDIKARKVDPEKLDPIKRWEAQFGIAAKRAEKSAAQRKTELDAAREEGRRAALTEGLLPNTRPLTGSHSPVFRTAAQGTSKLQRPQPGDRMAGAREALATGKYRKAS